MFRLSDPGYFVEVATGYGVMNAYLAQGFKWVIYDNERVWYLKNPLDWASVRWVHNYLDKERLEMKMREAEVKYMMGE